MIYKDTVFILGAGASWHYGYPTGEGLIEAIKDALEKLTNYTIMGCRDSSYRQSTPNFINAIKADGIEQKWSIANKNLAELRRRIIFSNPLVIDYFLSKNMDLKDYGNLAISMSIFQASAGLPNFPPTVPLKEGEKRTLISGDWNKFLVQKLTSGCGVSSDLLKNKVNFITFNYDNSLEINLEQALSHYNFFAPENITEFLSDGRIRHVYGALKFGNVVNNNFGAEIYDRMQEDLTSPKLSGQFSSRLPKPDQQFAIRGHLDMCWEASKLIKTIEEVNKDELVLIHRECGDLIEKAKVIYILGLGFDQNNIERIGLNRVTGRHPTATKIFYTNFRDSNKISKAAAKLFGGDQNDFVKNIYNEMNKLTGAIQVEKSTRDVYGAFANDFDEPETYKD